MKSIPTPHQSGATLGDTSLVLRVCRADHTSHDGFQWPDKIGAEVIAPDWEDNQKSGHGLHGWLFGQGDHNCIDYWESPDAMWYVLEVQSDSIVNLSGKCKFPRATVHFIGARADAANYLIEHEPRAHDVPVIGLAREVGDYGVAIGGSLSVFNGGDDCTIYGGCRSTITGGNGCTLIGEGGCTIIGKSGCKLTGGQDCSITGSDGSILAGGELSELRFRWWDSGTGRYRTVIAYVGEDGIEPNVFYTLDYDHKVVRAQENVQL